LWRWVLQMIKAWSDEGHAIYGRLGRFIIDAEARRAWRAGLWTFLTGRPREEWPGWADYGGPPPPRDYTGGTYGRVVQGGP
ncbi:hypothetical protein LCGC14_1604560, partial [marine sediment metagenome]